MRQRIQHLLDGIIAPPRLPYVYLLPALALCLLLQWQITLFSGDSYRGLRFNAADLILPFLGLLIGARIFLGLDKLPRWDIPALYYGIAGLAVIMTGALINGYHTTGEWDRWALLNKYAGFFVLLAYLGVGGWIGSRPVSEWARAIFPVFIGIWGVILTGTLLSLIWFDMRGDFDYLREHYPLSAYMGNRNAFALLSFCVLALFTATHLKKEANPSPFLYWLWALAPAFYLYNASRAGMVILPLLLVLFLVLNIRLTIKCIAPALAAGALFVYILSLAISPYALNTTKRHVQNASTLIASGIAEHGQESLNYDGDKIRAKTYGDALSLWSRHKLSGGGLGAFRAYQIETRGQYSDVIDSTPLWLLAETGIIGLAAFAGLFSLALWRIFRKIKSKDDPHGVYLGIFLMLAIFGMMSLVHELLYTRFIWFFMGLALALPPAERKTA